MNKKTIRIMAIVGVALVLVVVFIMSLGKNDIGPCTEYKCDVKHYPFITRINIDKDGADFAYVSGTFHWVTDPLTMYNLDDTKIAYAGDEYHVIAQDSHGIYVNNVASAEMVGRFAFFGEKYDIYDSEGNKIAKAEFNQMNTAGKLYDMNENVIADFSSKLFFDDFDVRITEKCEIDEKTVLMIFCSYYSDQKADSAASSSSSSKKSSN